MAYGWAIASAMALVLAVGIVVVGNLTLKTTRPAKT